MKVPYTKSGKCGGIVWQRARYGQISYQAFIPANPNTPAQAAVRSIFAAVSKRWSQLTQAQRDAWIAVARTKKSRPRLFQCGVLTGCQLFVKINVPLAYRGEAQVDLPPQYLWSAKPATSSPFCISQFDQLPMGPLLFLKANQIIGDWHCAACELPALAPPAAG